MTFTGDINPFQNAPNAANAEPGAGSIYTGQHEDSVYNILKGILFFSVVIMVGLVLGCAKSFSFTNVEMTMNTQEGSA
jgi:hypothetical protein